MSSKCRWVFLLAVLLVFIRSPSAETKANGKATVECKETSCGKVPNAFHSLFISPGRDFLYTAICHNVSEKGTLRYQARLQCISPDYMLKKTELDCKSGKWIPTPPASCTLKPKVKKSFFEQHKWMIIGGSGGGALCLIVIIVIGITVYLIRKKRQRKLLDGLRTDMSVNEGVSNPAYGMGSVHSFNVLRRSGYHKVWSCKRNRKKFIHGKTLQLLIKAASLKFGYTGEVRLVLEEDGTEVDNDEIFNACAGRVFVLLQPGEQWLDGAYESLINAEKRLIFGVCSYDRKIRKWIMTNSLPDLIHQASKCLHLETPVKITVDGTDIEIIKDDQLLENRHKVLIVTSINTKHTTGNMYSTLEDIGLMADVTGQVPYQDLRPAHHVHRGKLRPQDDGIELSDIKYDQHRASAKSHHGSRH